MQNTPQCEEKQDFLNTLISMEDLAEKKTKIYSRLLTDTALAKAMEVVSAHHAERKQALKELLYGKAKGKNAEKKGEESAK